MKDAVDEDLGVNDDDSESDKWKGWYKFNMMEIITMVTKVNGKGRL